MLTFSFRTVASAVNSLAAVTIQDFLHGICDYQPKEHRGAALSKWISAGFGVLSFLLVFVVEQLGSLLQVGLALLVTKNKCICFSENIFLGACNDRILPSITVVMQYFKTRLVVLPVSGKFNENNSVDKSWWSAKNSSINKYFDEN